MKLAILNCLKANQVCTGAACLKALQKRTGSFAQYEDEKTDLVAFGRCNGCEAGLDKEFRAKLNRIINEGAQVCHVGVCTVRQETGKECSVITEAAEYLESHGVHVLRGTH